MKGVMMTKDIDENTLGLSEKEKAFLKAEEERMGMKLKELVSPPVYNMCFACGSANPIGLHLHFFAIPDGCISFFTPRREHQSYNDRMHGGLIMTLMDEVMGNYLFLTGGVPAYTGKMESRFRSPLLIGETVEIRCHEEKRRGQLVIMTAKIIKEDGTEAAEAVSHMMLEPPSKG